MYATFHHNTKKDETLLHTTIAHRGIQDMDAKTQIDSEVLYDIRNVLNISL